jgi:hypothetical protein
MEVEKSKNNISGRSKRNFPLPIFQNEPMGRINEHTYESSRLMKSLKKRLRVEMFNRKKKAGPFLTPPFSYNPKLASPSFFYLLSKFSPVILLFVPSSLTVPPSPITSLFSVALSNMTSATAALKGLKIFPTSLLSRAGCFP